MSAMHLTVTILSGLWCGVLLLDIVMAPFYPKIAKPGHISMAALKLIPATLIFGYLVGWWQ